MSSSMRTLLAFLFLIGTANAFGYSSISVGTSKEKDFTALQIPAPLCPCTNTLNNKGQAARIVIGGHISKRFDVEADYTYIGMFSTTATDQFTSYRLTGESDTFAISLLATIPISHHLTVFPKIGSAYYDAQFVGYVNGEQKDVSSTSGTLLVKGIGAQYQITRDVGVRIEHDVYGSETKLTTVGLVFNY